MKRERNAFGKPFGMPARDAEGNVVGPTYEDAGSQEEDEESMPRVHAADTKGDVKSLDRKGQRNLYLLIKTKSGEDGKEIWKCPEGGLEKGELLHEVCYPLTGSNVCSASC
jgi:large subunit ribosomal protein L46